MGYTTDFSGQFDVTPKLQGKHCVYLAKFASTRRMKRNAEMTVAFPDKVRELVGLPIGPEAAYYVGDDEGYKGQSHSADIPDYNSSGIQPGLWCQWTPNDDGTAIEWDGGEKFYNYVEWIEFLIEHFLEPWGYTVNGEVEWAGEDRGDLGKIVVRDNHVKALQGEVSYNE